MIKSAKFFVPSLMFILLLAGCGQSGPSVTGSEVLVATESLDVKFIRVKSFSNSYMLFGGTTLKHRDAFFKVSLVGIDIDTAKYLYARFPDFHMCKSAGAPIAQREARQLNIVPANNKVLKTLKKALSEHKKSLQDDNKRACVMIKGDVLHFKSAVVRENGVGGQLASGREFLFDSKSRPAPLWTNPSSRQGFWKTVLPATIL